MGRLIPWRWRPEAQPPSDDERRVLDLIDQVDALLSTTAPKIRALRTELDARLSAQSEALAIRERLYEALAVVRKR